MERTRVFMFRQSDENLVAVKWTFVDEEGPLGSVPEERAQR